MTIDTPNKTKGFFRAAYHREKKIDRVLRSSNFFSFGDSDTGYFIFEFDKALCVSTIITESQSQFIICRKPIDDEAVTQISKDFAVNGDEKYLCSRLGEFLLFRLNLQTFQLTVVTDAFASFQAYHWTSEFSSRFEILRNFSCLVATVSGETTLEIDKVSVFDFLSFRRVHGKYTLFKDLFFLRASNTLTFCPCSMITETKRYVLPNFLKNRNSIKKNAELLVEALTSSLNRKCEGFKSPLIFLSGGHDTRLLLSVSEFKMQCLTLAFHENSREVVYARMLAEASSNDFIFKKLDPSMYQNSFAKGVHINGSMYSMDSIFLGLPENIFSEKDVGICGTGLDYMFQGMYQPRKCLGRLNFGSILAIAKSFNDPVLEYYENFSSRIPTQIVSQFYTRENFEFLETELLSRLRSIADEINELTNNPLDIYHWIFLSDPSRHYSFPDNLSMEQNICLVTPSYDQRVFELFWSIPWEQKFRRKLTIRALKTANKELSKINSANDDLPISGPFHKLCVRILRRLKLDHSEARKFKVPDQFARTWLPRKYIFDDVLNWNSSDQKKLSNNDYLIAAGLNFPRNFSKIQNATTRDLDCLWNLKSLSTFFGDE